MKGPLLILFLIITVLLETSFCPFFPVFGSQPNLLLVLILALQFLGFISESYWCAFLGGIFTDLLIGASLGFSSLVLLLLSGAIGLVRRFAEGSFPLLLLITLVASVVFRFIQAFPAFNFNLSALLKGGFLDVIVMVAVYPTLRYTLRSLFGRRELQVGA